MKILKRSRVSLNLIVLLACCWFSFLPKNLNWHARIPHYYPADTFLRPMLTFSSYVSEELLMLLAPSSMLVLCISFHNTLSLSNISFFTLLILFLHWSAHKRTEVNLLNGNRKTNKQKQLPLSPDFPFCVVRHLGHAHRHRHAHVFTQK